MPGYMILNMKVFCLFFPRGVAIIYFTTQKYLDQESEKEINQFCSL